MATGSNLGLEEQLALRIERELKWQMDEIIRKMQGMAKDFLIENADKKSPFKNVLSVATDASSSLEEIKNYIRYQVGRKESSPVWKISQEQKLFAKEVVEQIDSLSEDVTTIMEGVKKNLPEASPLYAYLEEGHRKERLQKKIHLKLAQLYLGYLAREHTARVGEAAYNAERSQNQKPRNK